ncbi:hypothetical protein, partial [Bacillus sp. FSL R12-0069]|uniref:hypothetical protein n=1 Tax=Bacillus sp. FSL R12-0069 TaxID=2975342 RepID=UPI0030F77D62
YRVSILFRSIEQGGSAGTIASPSRATQILVFGMFGLATCSHLPNFGMQWRKGGDFLRGFFKKYYLTIVWRKTPFNFYKIIE